MKIIPPGFEPYKRTPTFTQTTVPRGLRKSHSTKEGVWGKIVVVSGELKYCIESPHFEEITLEKSINGVIEPQIQHFVEPLDHVEFYVEFYRRD